MNSKGILLIVGSGGHGRAVAEAAALTGEWTDIVFADDAYPAQQQSGEWRIAGSTAQLPELAGNCQAALVAIGNQAVRQRLTDALADLGIPLATIVHPRAWVSKLAEIGQGSAIMAGAVVGACARLGRGVIVNANATADHDTVLGDFAHLGVGVQLAGGVVVEDRAWLQAGSCAGYRVRVPADAVLPPGSRLIAD
ncbi:acetyltransferase [Achromobacter insolitus]|jgi:sugar O-acyltransferase (sialic acid O-acetyltransferase NeuD family)|uniref:Acetyltransferase EpsM n=1 Tax=Achromobacter insolitus TaxID=217204 RepID=A0A6S7F1F3_9BURK|nr:acetyltransferase [Achromobacter insolitus]APX77729.1 acetyltransferase [Achromobacter insolitus]OAE55168.1 acetyltransferase [Achromobacter insolitus]OCZ54014.1 acetyltransferase [Achromobacter insolitus]OWT57152.1 acetyltransferase [Achromobacter insolitus]CAB3668441.1 Putative acetyltransferase EpsM [Achromobacter insolitus]